jgi:hypothetical protein
MWTTEGIGLDYTGRRLYGFTALRLYGRTSEPGVGIVKSLGRIVVDGWAAEPV